MDLNIKILKGVNRNPRGIIILLKGLENKATPCKIESLENSMG